jgi:hypothetical protein
MWSRYARNGVEARSAVLAGQGSLRLGGKMCRTE